MCGRKGRVEFVGNKEKGGVFEVIGSEEGEGYGGEEVVDVEYGQCRYMGTRQGVVEKREGGRTHPQFHRG